MYGPAGSVLRVGVSEAIGAAARYGPVEQVTWRVSGRELELAPITADAAPVVTGESIRDLGSLIARMVIEELGGSLVLDGEILRIRL